jgi:prefoldin alpha subunit
MAKPIIVGSEDDSKKAEEMQEKLQEKLLIYQILKQQMDNVQNQILLIENAFLEIENSKQALTDIKKSKEKDVLIPLGSGCYAKGNVANNRLVLSNIGTGIMVERNIEAVLQDIEQRKTGLEKQFEELQKNMQMLVGEMNSIASDLEAMKNDN